MCALVGEIHFSLCNSDRTCGVILNDAREDSVGETHRIEAGLYNAVQLITSRLHLVISRTCDYVEVINEVRYDCRERTKLVISVQTKQDIQSTPFYELHFRPTSQRSCRTRGSM